MGGSRRNAVSRSLIGPPRKVNDLNVGLMGLERYREIVERNSMVNKELYIIQQCRASEVIQLKKSH